MKKGISLIVLVITIIVMIILAASVVITLSNTGIINKASQAVDLTNEKQVEHIATLIWAEAYMDELRGEELARKVKEELNKQNITENDWNIIINDSGITIGKKEEYNHNAPELHPSSTIPAGAFYANLGTMTFYNEMPDTVSDYDCYIYGQYIYVYQSSNMGWSVGLITSSTQFNGTKFVDILPDYSVTTRNLSTYDPILESINGEPIVYIDALFSDCTSLVNSPVLPVSVTSMYGAFRNCTSLTTTPILPSNVTEMGYAFYGCTSLTTATPIPYNVYDMQGLFEGCIALTGTVEINAADPRYYGMCFENTTKPILLTGSSPLLELIADEFVNVTVAN